ncbi:hypothetical protein EZV62_012633 [Acer yangbiense]|uniref:Ionotropic glutamate receptor C-terminal domain-containing protein n=1 Tax=Acer yangbiense TaxID=1000413 RepID=A0A5C7HWD9_9ROSI|nr:hypothetical protein EZV62_012633 [Acer yangbiense]
MTLWFPFSALAIPQRELVVRDWSRFVLVIWIGFAVILMQIYTASLSSVLTVDQLQPTIFDGTVELHRVSADTYDTIEEYHNALTKGHKNGGVAAIFDEIPYIRVFLAEYVSHYMMAGRLDLYTELMDLALYAFPIGSPLVSNFWRAILKVREQREIMDEIEKKYFGHTITSLGVAPQISPDGPRQLHSSSLAGLFVIVGIATLLALGYIWSKPVALAKQLSTRYFSSHDQPTNATELVAQSTPQVDSANENSHELEESVGEF